jgi:hypothetical protein
MKKLIEVMNESHSLVDDIHKHAEGFDPEVLLEVVFLTNADFSEPMDAETMLASMQNDKLL